MIKELRKLLKEELKGDFKDQTVFMKLIISVMFTRGFILSYCMGKITALLAWIRIYPKVRKNGYDINILIGIMSDEFINYVSENVEPAKLVCIMSSIPISKEVATRTIDTYLYNMYIG